jgi:signal transduction histidine kinase
VFWPVVRDAAALFGPPDQSGRLVPANGTGVGRFGDLTVALEHGFVLQSAVHAAGQFIEGPGHHTVTVTIGTVTVNIGRRADGDSDHATDPQHVASLEAQTRRRNAEPNGENDMLAPAWFATSGVSAIVLDGEGHIAAVTPPAAALGLKVGNSFWEALVAGQKNRVVNDIGRRRAGFDVDLRFGDAVVTCTVAVDAHGDGNVLWLFPMANGDAASESARQLRQQNAILLDLGKAEAIDAGEFEQAIFKITEAAAAGLGCARSSVWFYNDDETAIIADDLYQLAERQHGAKGFTLTAAAYPAYFAALAEDRTIAADDCREHPATREFKDGYLVPLGITSMLEAPIRRKGKLVGVLCNEHIGPIRTFTQEEQNFAANVADYVTRAMEAAARREANEKLEQYAAGLEEKVRERTRAIQLVLDSTGDGLLTVLPDGTLGGEASRAVTAWFGPVPVGAAAGGYLFSDDVKRAELALTISDMVDDVLPFEVIAAQAPRTIERDGRTLRIGYRPVVEDGVLVRVLLMIRDASAEVAAERAERHARELVAMVEHLLRDKAAFISFLEESEVLLQRLGTVTSIPDAKRNLHTLKGNAALHGLEGMAARLHDLESSYEEDPEALARELEQVRGLWRESRARIDAIIGDGSTAAIQLSRDEHQAFIEALERAKVGPAIIAEARSWRSPSTHSLVERLRGQVERIGRQLGKDIEVEVADDGHRVPREGMEPFFAGLVHVVRNAIDHGIEDAASREAVGKPRRGHVRLVAANTDGVFEVAIHDDGRGIDWEAVRQRAVMKGIPSSTAEELQRALFADGLSTRDEVTAISGRGVGLGAVREACLALGGDVVVDTDPGHATTFRFRFPSDLAHAAE